MCPDRGSGHGHDDLAGHLARHHAFEPIGDIRERQSDLSDGRHMELFNFGVQYDAEFGDWLVSAKGGITTGSLKFSAFYSTTNPAGGNEFASDYLDRARTAFGSRSAESGTVSMPFPRSARPAGRRGK